MISEGSQLAPIMSCVPAAAARVVGVIVRGRGPDHWSCVTRWDVGAKHVDLGAWTRLRLLERRCRLSPDGEFLMYVAQGSMNSPFSRFYGGAVAISRLPWLAALTNARPACVAGGGKTRHALPADQQEHLWHLFDDVPAWDFRLEDWPTHLGAAWMRHDPADPSLHELWNDISSDQRIAAIAHVPGRDGRLVAIAHATRLSEGRPTEPRFHLQLTRRGETRTLSLPDCTWAYPDINGAILLATRDLHLQRVMVNDSGDTWALHAIQDHDLSNLSPAPGAAPAWATAPVSL